MKNSVHIYGPSFSTLVRSVMLCCEEKGVSYSVGVELPTEQAQRLAGQHPFGQIPLLSHGEFVLFETGPICRYLDRAFPGPELQPREVAQQALVEQWTQLINIKMDDLIVRQYLLEFAFPKGEQGEVRQEVVAANSVGLNQALSVIEQQLGSDDFFCSTHFSTADALLVPMLDYLSKLPTSEQVFAAIPKTKAYIETMQLRASGKRVLLPFN